MMSLDREIDTASTQVTIRIGFTGTRDGMTLAQRDTLEIWLIRLALEPVGKPEFHHGDCVGADAEACEIARRLSYEIHMHPPSDPIRRAYTSADVIYEERPYRERNRHIVRMTNYLIAAPKLTVERGGTWYTYNHARQQGSYKRAMLITPKGVAMYEPLRWPNLD